MLQIGVLSSYPLQMLSLLYHRGLGRLERPYPPASSLLPTNGAITCLAQVVTVERLYTSSVVYKHKTALSALWRYVKCRIDELCHSNCDFSQLQQTWDVFFPSFHLLSSLLLL